MHSSLHSQMHHYLVVSGQLHNLSPSFTHNDRARACIKPTILNVVWRKKLHTLPGIKPQSTAQALSLLNYSSTIIIM